LTVTSMILFGILGWVVVLGIAALVGRLARAKDMVRVLVWTFVGFNVLYLSLFLIVRPKSVSASVTADRIQVQAERTGKSLDRLQQEVDAAKAMPGADPARFAAGESLIAQAREALRRTGEPQKGRGSAYDELRKANKLAQEARHVMEPLLEPPGR
jgi:hypothetical protein